MLNDRILGPISQIAFLCAIGALMTMSSLAALNAASLAASAAPLPTYASAVDYAHR
ncbi:MAG: hypothetical protein NW205_04450 [Hyphomicrobiaceae bacterium]|nr:hypothetical protein [Hyphomicrobiaceae bacterium]